MTLVTLPYRTQLAAGQPEDISMVLADFDAILAVLNGDIRNDNIASAAAIAVSKISNPASIAKILRGDGTWVGGMSVIDDQTRATDGNFDINPPIPGTYAHLMMMGSLRSDIVGQIDSPQLRFNNDSANNYDFNYFDVKNTTVTGGGTPATNGMRQLTVPGASADASKFGAFIYIIPAYASTAMHKMVIGIGGSLGQAAGMTNWECNVGFGLWRNTAAITRIQLAPGSGGTNFKIGSRCTTYGLGV